VRLNRQIVYFKCAESQLDLYPVFIKEKSKGLLYYKTDTHWNVTAKKIAVDKIVDVIKPVNFRKHLLFPVRSVDTTICRSTDLLNNLMGDTTTRCLPITCIIDSAGRPIAKCHGSEIVVIGDSFGQNDQQFGADIGSLLAYKLQKPVGVYCTSVVGGAYFLPFVKKTFQKLTIKPKIVVVVFSSRKLLWHLE
jgi:hypothetical protein